MKKLISVLLLLTLALSLAACTSKPKEVAFSADLPAFYEDLMKDQGEGFMTTEITGEMLDYAYAGLGDIELKQSVIYTATISATAFEIAMVEVANAADVDKVKEIFQKRIDAQVGTDDAPGGAWYPETIEVWKNSSEIVTNGNYVCMFVGEAKDAMVAAFNDLGKAA